MVKRSSTNAANHRARIRKSKPNCHICGKAIDYDLPHLDPGAFVVDHVKALAKGGLDVPSNTAAAHRGCNAKKSAREYAPIVRRSGALVR